MATQRRPHACGAAYQALTAEIGLEVHPLEAASHSVAVERVREALGADFERAWSEGGSMTLDEAVAYARARSEELTQSE